MFRSSMRNISSVNAKESVNTKMSVIFGPVHSRRFGVSLGIDLSSSEKQCNFDCLYCELAPQQAVRNQHISLPVKTIIDELKNALTQHPSVDVITLTANGEPTMYPELSTLIDEIDKIKGKKETLILSNSAGLNDPNVFDSLLKLDQVKLSLDSATPSVFKKIDRPHPDITIETIIQSIMDFSRRYSGKLFIEILFVKGLNDTLEEVAALNRVLLDIPCTRIDIGTIDRPPAYPVEGISYDELYELSQHFDPNLPIHIVSRSHIAAVKSRYTEEEILSTLDKRPLTDDDIETLFDDSTKKTFNQLVSNGKVISVERSRVFFWIPHENLHRKRSK